MTNPPRNREQIREATEHDRRSLREIHAQAFDGRTNEANLVEMLHLAHKANPSLVTIAEGKIVAHIVFSPVTIERAPENIQVVGLGPLAVLPGRQRRGIGSRLVLAGVDACRARQCHAIVVLGSPGFYSRFGFRPAMDFELCNEYINDEHFMIRELRDEVASALSGMVRYAPEFRLAGC